MKVFTAILNFRHTADTLRCVAALRASSWRDQRLVVVDNGSTEESRAALRAGLGATTLLASEENLGYAGGNNLAIAHALERDADLVWLLNPDTLPEPRTLERLVDTAVARPDAGVLGCRITYAGSRPARIWFNGGVIDWERGGDTSHRDDGRRDARVPAGAPFCVDYVTGAAMLVRREVFSDVGLLPTDYFLYFEETDFNVRAQRAGWEILVDSRARMAHDKRSTGRLPAPYYVYYFVRNRLAFGTTFTALDVDQVDAHLDSWVQAWRAKVTDRDPAWLPAYEALVRQARADARAGARGQRADLDQIVASALAGVTPR